MNERASVSAGCRRNTLAPVLLCIFLLLGFARAEAEPGIWVSAYYAGWMQGCGYPGNNGYLRAEEIDYSAVTHIIHFAVEPAAAGAIDTSINCISAGNSAAVTAAAHAAGKKVLLSVGGWATETEFLAATDNASRANFIQNLVAMMTTRGYDGLDIDWEPLSAASLPQFSAFVTELRRALDVVSPRPLLTAAVAWEPAVFAQLQDAFDQINIMTYELSGPWPGWITWHNAPVYDGAYWFKSTGQPVPSANGMVDDFLSQGILPGRLGIGIEFYGALWSGGTGTTTGGAALPGQSWKTAPSTQMIAYHEIMDTYYQPQYYRWDNTALASYLSIDNYGSSGDRFISFEDETACREKITYVRNKGIGGVIIFELGGGWRPAAAVPDSLLQAVKEAAGTGVAAPPPAAPVLLSPADGAQGVSASPLLTWTAAAGAGSYSLEVSTDAAFRSVISLVSTTATSYPLNGLSNNTVYYWRVKATNAAGESTWSGAGSFSTMAALPSETVVATFSADPRPQGMLLSWQTTSEYRNSRFEVERRYQGYTRWTRLARIAGAGTTSAVRNYSFMDTKVVTGQTYVYRLKQVNADGTYKYTPEITVTR